ncbi:hypothetical protein [Ferrimonas pelagia]|uniref:Uncharacterized protein n=1 Tax=Ferrimonas pelagia TaxID=1177826 RepID=A0ABP9EEJ5_9GAMM
MMLKAKAPQFGQGLGAVILAVNVGNLLMSLWQAPELVAMVSRQFSELAPYQAQLVTAALLLLNALWLGLGAYLAVSLMRGRLLPPWKYYVCASTLLFGGLLSKGLAVAAMLLRLFQDAVRQVVK